MTIGRFDQNLKAKYHTPELGIGPWGERIGEDILKSMDFDCFKKQGKTLQGQPFDRLCRRSERWYIVEIKAAQHGFVGTPSHTQKRRMREVLEEVKEVEPVLLQINLGASKYKIRYGREVRLLITDSERKRLELDNIINWVKVTIAKQQ